MHKPVRSELNWPMYSTHAIIIAKEREMKNLPVQGAKSKTVACFGSLGFSSLLWFFSSFNFLGSPVLSCIFLSASVFVLLRSAPCVVPPVLLSGFLYSSAGSLSFLPFPPSASLLVLSVFFRFPSFSSVLVIYCGSPLESSGSGAVVVEDGDLAYSECWTEGRKLAAVAVVRGCWK